MPSNRPTREPAENVSAAVQSIDSKINIIAQKIKTMEKNEEILGRTIITLNEKMDRLAREGPSSSSSSRSAPADEGKYATKQDVRELKAMLDAINPLEFATIDQVKELLQDALKKMRK